MNLPLRLQAAAEMVSSTDKVADIGADHGLLSLYLADVVGVKRIYASDNKSGPYNRLRKAIKNANLEAIIHADLADGLSKLPEDIDTVIMAGMGAETISGIMAAEPDKLDQLKKLILVPHTHAADLRSFLAFYGYVFVTEKVVKEDGHFYEIMEVRPGKKIYCELELVFGPINLNEKSAEFMEMWHERYNQNEALLAGEISASRRDEIMAEQEKIKTLWSKPVQS